jgi:hypothetical protein
MLLVVKATQRIKLREHLFPGSEGEIFAPSIRTTVGFCRPPRVITLVAGLADLAQQKVAPGRLYMSLWVHDWGEGLVEVDPGELIYEADPTLSALRADRHFREKMKALAGLGLIQTSPRGHREHGYALLRDPHLAVLELQPQLASQEWWTRWWGAFEGRCREVGVDLDAYRQRLRKEESAAS